MFNARGNRRNNNRAPPPRREQRYGMASQDMNNGSNMTSGPLVTEHLNLRALDLELALLKQKREIIEKQQEMFSYGRKSNYYNQPEPYNNQTSTVQSFSQYYDEPRSRDQGVKRRGIEVWDTGVSAPKRFGADAPPVQYPRPQSFKPAPSQNQFRGPQRSNPRPPPLMGTHAPKPRFNPTKVTKQRPSPALKTVKSAPVAERKHIISKASNLVGSTDPSEILYEEDWKTSSKVLGRLELALGVILKDVKDLYGKKEPVLTPLALKVIKKDIRARMRKVMMGKAVTTTTAIVEEYRKVYSKETNAQILQHGVNALPTEDRNYHNLAIQIIEKGRPDWYFKKNFEKLLSTKLREMFDQLRKLYKPDERTIVNIMKDILAEQDMQMMIKDIVDLTDAIESKSDLNESKKDQEVPVTDENVAKETSKSDDNDVSIIEMPEEQVIIDLDQNVDGETTEKDVAENGEKDGDNQNENKSTEVKENSDVAEQKQSKNADKKAEDSKKDDSLNTSTKDELESKSKLFQIKALDKLVDSLLNSKLPQVLPYFKNVIMNEIMTANEDYKNTVAYILVQTKKKEQGLEKRQGGESTVETQKSPLLYVKVFGRPYLPKRNQMQTFLDTFNPSSIKKHRTVHSLLFVGFANKNDYDRILAANKTVIGNCTLDIRPSENKFNKQAPTKKDVEVIEEVPETIKIDPDMDSQIDDLLQSIRSEEEQTLEGVNKQVEQQNETTGNTENKTEDASGVVEVKDSEPETINTNTDTAITNIDGETNTNIDSENPNIDSEPNTNVDAEESKGNNEAIEVIDDEESNGDKVNNDDNAKVENPAVEAVKNDAKGTATPTRQSTRIASSTPIRTRRASRLTQN